MGRNQHPPNAFCVLLTCAVLFNAPRAFKAKALVAMLTLADVCWLSTEKDVENMTPPMPPFTVLPVAVKPMTADFRPAWALILSPKIVIGLLVKLVAPGPASSAVSVSTLADTAPVVESASFETPQQPPESQSHPAFASGPPYWHG